MGQLLILKHCVHELCEEVFPRVLTGVVVWNVCKMSRYMKAIFPVWQFAHAAVMDVRDERNELAGLWDFVHHVTELGEEETSLRIGLVVTKGNRLRHVVRGILVKYRVGFKASLHHALTGTTRGRLNTMGLVLEQLRIISLGVYD